MAGIDPHRDVALSVIPPPAMVRTLESGEIDGFAVGEPWSQRASDLGIGVPIVTSDAIWASSPEKVFAVTEEWALHHPNTLRAAVRALLEAATWVDREENRLETVHVIAGESYVDAPVESVAPSMLAPSLAEPGEGPRTRHAFHRSAANHPWVSHGLWYLIQMVRWGQVEKPISLRETAERVYRPEIHREAAEALGWSAPEISEKSEGLHDSEWWLHEAPTPIRMGPDHFMDGHVFRPDEPIAYLEGFEVSDLRVRLDDLALLDGPTGEASE
jgi:nitrate/nitrite transport system substrate-binding protein